MQGNKYDYSKVKYESSKKFVTIICPKHGEFTQMPAEHLAGKGCKYCAHQTFHPLESLANIAPEIAAEWDYEMNKDSGYTRKLFRRQIVQNNSIGIVIMGNRTVIMQLVQVE